MLRWTLGLTRWDQVKNEDVRKTMGVAPIMERYGHVIRSEEESIAKRALRLSTLKESDPKEDQRSKGWIG